MGRKNPNRAMTGIQHDLGRGEPIRIIPLSDLHIGDKQSDMKLVKELIQRIKDDQDCYTVLCGDLMNTAIIGSKSDSYHEKMNPDEQIEECVDLLEPISDRILCIVPGNHEERISRSAGIDTTKRMAAELGKKNLYCAESALVYIRTGKNPNGGKLVYSMYVNHGHGGGGRRAGSKINSLQDLGYVIDADLIIAGHTHVPATFRQSSIRCVPQSFTAEYHEQVLVNVASALTYGGYGKRGGYQPPSNRYPVIELSATKKDIKVTL